MYDARGEVQSVNRAFVQTFGWQASEMMDHTANFVPPERQAESNEYTRRGFTEGQIQKIETQRYTYVLGKGFLILEPKTNKSQRMLVLPKFVIEALREHLVKRERLSKSPSWKESGLVFITDIGTPFSPRNLIRLFKSKIQEAGLPDIRFHDLRHGVASLLLEKNVHPKIVSELLGHSSVNLTLNTYSQIINLLNRVAADTMDDAVGQK